MFTLHLSGGRSNFNAAAAALGSRFLMIPNSFFRNGIIFNSAFFSSRKLSGHDLQLRRHSAPFELGLQLPVPGPDLHFAGVLKTSQ